METNTAIDTSNIPLVSERPDTTFDPNSIMARFNAPKTEEPAPAADKVEPTTPDIKPTEPAPVEPAPKEEKPKTEEDPPETKGMSEPAKVKWKDLRAKEKLADELTSKVAELEKKLAEARPDDMAQIQKQLAAKEKQLTELDQKLATYDVKASQEYQTTVEKPLIEIADVLRPMAESYEIDYGKLVDAMVIKDPVARLKSMAELMEGVDPMVKAEISGYAKKVLELTSKGDSILANAGEARKEIEYNRHKESEAAKAKTQKSLEQARDAVFEKMQAKLPFLSEEEVATRVKNVDMSTTDPGLTAYRAMAGEALVDAVKRVQSLEAELAKVTKELDRRNAAKLPVGGGAAAPDTNGHSLPQGDDIRSRFANFVASRA